MTPLLALAAAGQAGAAAFPISRSAQPLVAPTAGTPGYGSALLALILVVGLILGLSWLLRRLPGNSFNGSPGLRPIASLAVGSKERLLVVEVGGEQLLLGIAPGGIQVLHKLSQPLPEPTGSTVDFAALLGKRLAGKLPNALRAGDKERAA